MRTDPISAAEQLALLLEYGLDLSGKRYTVPQLAAAGQISDQTLLNILNGRTDSPRLSSVRAICAVYGLSVDYFDCETIAACRAYLSYHRQRVLPLVGDIADSASDLNPDNRQRIANIIRWIQSRESGTSNQDRKRHQDRQHPGKDT